MAAYSSEWIKRLAEIRRVDPDAARRIEQRAEEISAGYTEQELYSKKMEGGTGERWEREQMSRAMFQAFSEYEERHQGEPQQTDDIMPEDAPYGPTTERAIQQVMQHQGLTRAQAIQYLATNSVDPMVREELAQARGGGAQYGRHREPYNAPPSQYAEYSRGAERVLSSPQSRNLDLSLLRGYSPTEERVATNEEGESEGIVGPGQKPTGYAPEEPPVTGDGTLSGGAETVGGGYGTTSTGYTERERGEAATQREPMDTKLRLLQAIAAAGGSYFGGRDVSAANQRQRAGTANANLINALAGNMVAQAPREAVRPGKMTSILKAASGLAGDLVKDRQHQRNLDQQAILSKLRHRAPDNGNERKDLVHLFKDSGYTHGSTLGKMPLEEYQNLPLHKSDEALLKQLSSTMQKTFHQLPVKLQAPLLQHFRVGVAKGFEYAQNQRKKIGQADATERKDVITAIANMGKANQTAIFESNPPVRDANTLERAKEEFGSEIAELGLTAADVLAAHEEGKAEIRNVRNKEDRSASLTVKSFESMGKDTIERGQIRGVTFEQALLLNQLSSEIFNDPKTTDERRFQYMMAFNEGQDEAIDKSLEAADDKAPKEIINEWRSGRAKVKKLEQRYWDLKFRGVAKGRLWASELWGMGEEAAYDNIIEGFAVDLAKELNGGRPSDKDAEAIKKLLPKRTAGEEMATHLFANLYDMLDAKLLGLQAGYNVPVGKYLEEAGSNYGAGESGRFTFNEERAMADIKNRIVTPEEIEDMIKSLNDSVDAKPDSKKKMSKAATDYTISFLESKGVELIKADPKDGGQYFRKDQVEGSGGVVGQVAEDEMEIDREATLDKLRVLTGQKKEDEP